jgi:uncharacterized membrane protein
VGKNSINRIWEIDFLRGFAIIMMIIFHILFDIKYFDIYRLDLYHGIYQLIFYPFAIVFLILVGISLTLSYSKVNNILSKRQLLIKYQMRGLKIFGLGLIITIVSWLYIQDGFIVFGVLHCIGLSIILSYPLINYRYKSLISGIVIIFIGLFLMNYTFNFSWLIWLGFTPSYFYTVDYFPIFPYFGVVLIGIFIGNSVYPNHKRNFQLKDLSKIKIIKFICFLGRNSLIIYFLHQPIILGFLYLLFL